MPLLAARLWNRCSWFHLGLTVSIQLPFGTLDTFFALDLNWWLILRQQTIAGL
jgi:hypothetical protein